VKRASLLALALLALAELILGSALYHNYSHELDKRLEFGGSELNTEFTTIVDSYRQVVEAIFRQAIQRPEIIDLLTAANQADPALQSKLRGRLYRQLYPVYKLLRERDIRVLQFVLADGRSFLRFNRPDLYNDNIAADRPVLQSVLTQKQPAQGFENGRVYPGFRYSFPLFKDAKLVAVADFSAAFNALHRVLLERHGHAASFKQFLIRRDLIEAVAHPSARSLFIASPIDPAFVTEDERSGLRDIAWSPDVPPYLADLNRSLAGSRTFRSLIQQGSSASIYQCLSETACFIVSVRPVRDSLNRSAGYIVASTLTNEPLIIRNQHLLAFLVGSLLLLGGGTAFRRWVASRQRLQTISQNMAEGMYVMDTRGRILFINLAATDLLGFSAEEAKGRVAHDLFHVHSNNAAITASNCPIRRAPLEGRTYHGDNELFRRSDGGLVQVSVSSSPLREEGEITGSVVLFRDITDEYKTRIRLQQSDIAFRNLSEAVLVADASGCIQAVNHAFTAITGYSESEVLGRNPSILASGRHDKAFYQALWGSIEREGSWQGEIWNRRKCGEIYPERLSINSIRDDEGRVISYVSVFSDITEIRRKEERLRQLAFHDQLTGLPNRTSFQDLFRHAAQRAKRHESHLALLYLDLDRFKQINDTLGHLVGDKLLQTVAERIRENVREEDLVARLGGDEFTVLLEDIEHEEAPARVAHKLIKALRQPIEIESKPLHISTSIGISLFPQDGADTVTLMKNADAAMYLAKRGGRNSYSYFTGSMALEAEQRFDLENQLRVALAESQFVLYYQPKVLASNGRIIGMEALIRWRHPLRGLLAPNHFLGVADEAGLLPGITQWVVRSAARQGVLWREMGLDPGRIAINLDDQTFKAADAVSKLEHWVRTEGATPSELELEIVETVILHQGASQPLWQALVDAGFTLSIDDFGTGQSSLFRLKHLPIRTLKVDKAFVDDLDRAEGDRAIMRSIVSMAQSLGKLVLAEGVEREAQREVLRQIGCDQIQGYLVGKPATVQSITEILRENPKKSILTLRSGDDKANAIPRIH
jgi:diguanylate cyclase (GGDEF)-like protein/PAS domain S-box-containing protein